MAWPFGNRKKGFNFFDDMDEEFGRMREEMERMMEDAMARQQGGGEEGESKRYGPYVYGFSMRTGPDGKPVFEEFGNTKPPSKEMPSGEREPLIDVIDEKAQIAVIAELPGVEKKDIKLKAVGKTLSIQVNTPERKYSKRIELPAEVKPNTAKATYKNGVLEVVLKKKEKSKPKGEQIKVE